MRVQDQEIGLIEIRKGIGNEEHRDQEIKTFDGDHQQERKTIAGVRHQDNEMNGGDRDQGNAMINTDHHHEIETIAEEQFHLIEVVLAATHPTENVKKLGAAVETENKGNN